MFAKLYERDGRQILVTLERSGDDGPAVRVSFESEADGLDVCSSNGIYQTVARAEEQFAAMTEDQAFEIMRGVERFNIGAFGKAKKGKRKGVRGER